MHTHSSKTDADKVQTSLDKNNKAKKTVPNPLQRAANPNLLISPQGILQLQRTIGNQAVMQLFSRENQIIQDNAPEDISPVSDIIQRTGWHWYSGEWHPDTETSNQPPEKKGKYDGEYYNDGKEEKEEKKEKKEKEEEKEKEETIDDLKKRCGDSPLSDGTYNKGRSYIIKQGVVFKGEEAHSSNSVAKHPKKRLQDMFDAGATISQLKEVLDIWKR